MATAAEKWSRLLRLCTFPVACAWMFSFGPLGYSFQPPSEKPGNASAEKTERRAIAVEEARSALNALIESDSFLSDAPYMEPLKKRIRAENKNEPLLKAGSWGSAPGGVFIGPWGYEERSNSFSYIAKSKERDELFAIRGRFLLGENGKWTARICEASATKLNNFFGPREVGKIKTGMSLSEVTKILGVPPGANFAGEMGFTFPSDRRLDWPFTGTREGFKQDRTWFFSTKANEKNCGWLERAWISNDLAVFVTFDPNNKAQRILNSKVLCPNECWSEIVMPDGLRFEHSREKK
jgi:hypothetical protein